MTPITDRLREAADEYAQIAGLEDLAALLSEAAALVAALTPTAAKHIHDTGLDGGCKACATQRAVPGPQEGQTRYTERDLLQMFLDGVDAARSYGDNAFHLWGDQLLRQFDVAHNRLVKGEGQTVQPTSVPSSPARAEGPTPVEWVSWRCRTCNRTFAGHTLTGDTAERQFVCKTCEAPPAAPGAEDKMTDGDLLREVGMDGHKWAVAFMRQHGGKRLSRDASASPTNGLVDEGDMIAWFCNAIMAGYDEANRRCAKEAPSPAPAAELRRMFEAGIKVARSYGDNAHHLEGDQLERQFQRALSPPQGQEER